MRKNTLFGNIEEKNYSFKRERKKKDRRERNFNFVSDRESFISNLSFIHRCNYNFLQYLEN